MKIINLLESFFRNEGGWGIDSINAVALVNQSTHCHFCIPARYLVDSILKLFGRDIINNFIIISTFSESYSEDLPKALAYVKIPTTYYCNFYNRSLFVKTSGDNGINKL